MKMKSEKKRSEKVEDAASVLSEKDLAFDPEFSSNEHERAWHYHDKLVFKDGKFLVRIVFISYLRLY
jgi:hypothetical protein